MRFTIFTLFTLFSIILGQPAFAIDTGAANQVYQIPTSGGRAVFTTQIHGANGSVSVPTFSFANDTGSGLYRVGSGELGFSIVGAQVLDFKKSSPGGFGNIGMGGAASTSDSFILNMQRACTGVRCNAIITNTDTSAGASACWQLSSDAGNSLGEICNFSAATTTFAYANAMTVRANNASTHLSLIGGDLSTAYVSIFGAGDYTSTGETMRFNADHSISFMQEIATPANPASGTDKVYAKSDHNIYHLNSSGAEVQMMSNPMTAAGDIIYGGSSGTPTRSVLVPQFIRSYGPGSYSFYYDYAFLVSSATAAAGDTYTNNTITFTVDQTISSGILLYAQGSGPPTASGTLTRTSGSGSSTITFTAFRVPIGFHVKMVGGGGGSSASGASSAGSPGGNGTNSCFGPTNGSPCVSDILEADGGFGGGTSGGGGAGSSGCTINDPAWGQIYVGGSGSFGSYTATLATYMIGGAGGVSMFGGNGSAGNQCNGNGGVTGSGAGGPGTNATTSTWGGGGGGAGCGLEADITNPASVYYITVGSGGSGGGSGVCAGYAGGNGIITIEQRYQ